jgi:hypothetical protein
VLGELTGEDKADRGLDLARGEGGPAGVLGEAAGLGRELCEDVVDEGVHHGHALLAHAGVRVDLLEDLVDVDRERLGALLGALRATGLCGLALLCHCVCFGVLVCVCWCVCVCVFVCLFVLLCSLLV